MWKVTPAVFVVGQEYQIMIPTECECIMKVEIGGKTYYDASNGIMRSKRLVHKVTVPMEILNKAKSYRVCLQRVLERKHKFPVMGEIESKEYVFKPVSGECVRAYHVADNHGIIKETLNAVRTYGEIDLLILNGDLANNFSEQTAVWTVYELISQITGGEIPVLLVRGNHDARGKYAEYFTDYFPHQGGNTYFTFRIGNIWGIALDCGEDKPDDHQEYGNLVCCHSFREAETEFIKQVISNAKEEYEAPGVEHRLVVCHVPFTAKDKPPFDIEEEIYAEWVGLLGNYIKPEMVLSGHEHKWEIYECGSEKDSYGQSCPTLVGSALDRSGELPYFAGAGLEFTSKGIDVTFTDSLGKLNWVFCVK